MREPILGTPPDVMPAMRAARNGMIVVMVGVGTLLTIGVLLYAGVVSREQLMAHFSFSELVDGGEFVVSAISLFGLLLFLFPTSPTVRYGNLYTAIAIETATCLSSVALYFTRNDEQRALLRMIDIYLPFLGLTVPLFFFFYCALLARTARDQSLEDLALGALKRHVGIFLAFFVVVVMAMLKSEMLQNISLIAAGIAAFEYVFYIFRLGINFVLFRPVPFPKQDELEEV